MQEIEGAGILRVGLQSAGTKVYFPYHIDDQFSGVLSVSYPFSLDERALRLLPPIGVGVAAFLAQLCLARRLVLEFPSSPEMVEGILPVMEMLYDIRCWRDQLELMPLPEISLIEPNHNPIPFVTDSSKIACLIWSGGKDSTLSHILLTKNGFQVLPVHFSVNARAEQAEMRAVAHLAQVLGITYQTVEFDFPQYLDIARRYAGLWDIFPDYNVVPFGRDLVLTLLAMPLAQHYGVTYLCMGHEHGSRTSYLDYQGKRIARDDVESIKGGQLIEAYMQKFISPTARFFPPVAGLPEFRILHELHTKYPTVAPHISFCFWGAPCGRCSKCLRHYLVQRVLGIEGLVHFQANPLEGDNCPDLLHCIDNWQQDEGRSYTDMVLYCLAKLVERGDVRPTEYLLRRFEDEIYPHIADSVGQMYDRIMKVHTDPQVPPDFQIN
jgi:hypothetical protein